MSRVVDYTKISETESNINMDQDLFNFSSGELPEKMQDVCRIFYNNINGLEINCLVESEVRHNKRKKHEQIQTPVEEYTKVEAFLKQMIRWNVNISAVAEHCVDWNDTVPRILIKQIGKKYHQRGMWNVATSKVSVGNYIKPGGALIFNSEEMAIRTIRHGTDPWGMGRWAFQQYQAKKGHTLLIISAYRVGPRTGNPGSSTAWHQQKVMLTQAGRTDEPSSAFLTDIKEWLEQQQNQHDKLDIALFLDANEKWTQTSKIKQFADKVQLVNLNEYGTYMFPSTHPCLSNPSRNTTIDYCLCTTGFAQSVGYATLAPYDLACLGDHRGIIVDLNMKKLLGEPLSSSNDLQGRKLCTTNSTITKKYLRKVEEGFKHQRIYDRTAKLLYQWNNKSKAIWEVMKRYEALDREIFNICCKAEKECKSTHSGKAEWSPELASAIKELSYWRA